MEKPTQSELESNPSIQLSIHHSIYKLSLHPSIHLHQSINPLINLVTGKPTKFEDQDGSITVGPGSLNIQGKNYYDFFHTAS